MTRLPPILFRDYIRHVVRDVVLPRVALAAALLILSNIVLFATIVLE